jgi:hypothetical protein
MIKPCSLTPMARLIVRPAPSTQPSIPGGAIILGLGLGVAVGFVLGELLGPVPARALPRASRPAPAVDPSVRGLVVQARAVLDDDLMLRDCRLEVIPIGPGRIELHGWVDDRRSRARAARLVGDAVRADAIINCLLVHGEDDQPELVDESDSDELLA